MDQNRRRLLQSMLWAGSAASLRPTAAQSAKRLGIPGPFPGRVAAVHHPACIVSGAYQAEPARAMVGKGMMKLTGAPSPEEAWRVFFEPGDVVGIKVNPVGQPHVISDATVFQAIVEGLQMAGVKTRDIVAYDRYRKQVLSGGFDKWLPEGVRWTYATDDADPLQLDMDGYDADQYVEMALTLPKANPANPHHRRSYLARFISKDVNKMVNLCVLKHHQSAGVTIALKNMSHGLVNNVSRSHSSDTLNTCGTFIPAIVDHPVIRQKVVLHVLDAIKAAYHGGPGGKVAKYLWEPKTMYFATDPVALDKTGWTVIDKTRVAMGMMPIAMAKPDQDSNFLNMQVEHIEIAGALGLGEFSDEKIDLRRVELS